MKLFSLLLAISIISTNLTFVKRTFAADMGNTFQVSTTLDKADPYVFVKGAKYKWVYGTQAARSAHLNPPGKVNVVKLTGYFVTVGIETIFVVTEVKVTAMQG